ncbi:MULTISPECIES: MarR family transcriptional regulator [unclassified Microbacterium]|uniref:MarR family winged helix-turn-helix transcriptional regulator n=1 Tax=unclassified Microbacterium TaxID=2609290 RepID=UPI00214AE3FA|nr:MULTISPECIES: MarR family transcriptional regulator [unclassified Microbacterium]MCR2786108.1 MarR family transcriptional regulator [Microbacterium sp. zg.B96]WIM17034.1 MarR family transcriptional regulator [Microbacterium sp. zg-B96]
MLALPRDDRGKPATDRLNYTAYRLARALNRAAENDALSHGLTLPQLLILQVLGEGVPLSNAQIARRTFVSSQAAHVVSSELLTAELIERVQHPTNRRVRLVRLTERGWAALHECERALIAREVRLNSELDDTLGAALPEILDRAAEVLAGGYFGDKKAEGEAVALRRRPSRGTKLAPI